ncbi:MAG: hypothetical protein Q8K91_08365 [Hylemonella sp.]|nr:hypothetical protein [Hylemonella sp.]
MNSLLTQRLSDAVISLNGAGEIIDYNTAAKPYLRLCVEMLPIVKHEVAKLRASHSNQPQFLKSIPSGQANGASLELWLCKSASSYSLLLLPDSRSSPSEVKTSATSADLSFAYLIGSEVRSEMNALIEALNELKADMTSAHQGLSRKLERVSQLLVFLELMVDTLRAPEFVEGERVSVQALLGEVLSEMRGAQGDFVLNHEQSDKEGKQGFLYGQRQWLKTAVRALIESLDGNAPAHCQIEIRIRQNGSFIVVTGGYSSLQEWTRRRKAAAQLNSHWDDFDTPRAMKLDAGIRLTVARQIFELHGGQLRLELSDGDDTAGLIDGFTLLMPTGVPLRGRSPATCAHCIFPQQARSLAKDLAQLLARQPAPAHMSIDELQMLAQLTTQTGH